MIIKILGPGCKKCALLTEHTITALDELGVSASLSKTEDFKEIAAYGIMSTPALVINDEVISYGKVLKVEDIKKAIQKFDQE